MEGLDFMEKEPLTDKGSLSSAALPLKLAPASTRIELTTACYRCPAHLRLFTAAALRSTATD